MSAARLRAEALRRGLAGAYGVGGQRVRHDHQAMRAAAGGGCIVVLRNQFRDGLGELVAERRPVRRRPEANLGIHRQGRQAFARLFRTTNKVAHLADDPCAQGDEIARGQPIDFPIRIRGDRAQGARRNDVGSGRRHEQPFRQPAPLAFLGQPHQPVRLQRVQVVVDFLPSQADPRGQRRRRGGRGELGEESTPHGLQRHRRRCRIIDDLDVEHEEMVVLTTFIVNAWFKAFSDEFAESMSCRRNCGVAARSPPPPEATTIDTSGCSRPCRAPAPGISITWRPPSRSRLPDERARRGARSRCARCRDHGGAGSAVTVETLQQQPAVRTRRIRLRPRRRSLEAASRDGADSERHQRRFW